MEHPLERAIRLAAKTHKGQIDRFGQPYILHVMRVMTRGRDTDERILGALHDVLERSALTITDLQMKEFPPQVVDALKYITRDPKERYDEYIARVCMNGLASRVKVHDLEDKLDLRNVGVLTDADRRRRDKQKDALERLRKLEAVRQADIQEQERQRLRAF